MFISFEGSEGCGKSTQIQRLRDRLENAGHRIVLVREPGGTRLGERVRLLLQHDQDGEGMCIESELLLFCASRAQLVQEVILPALEAGDVVLADRFIDSTTAYQGSGRGLDVELIRDAIRIATGGLKPDVTFLLDMEAASGLARLETEGRERDRMERSGGAFFERVRAGYLALAEKERERITVLDAADSADRIEFQIQEVLRVKSNGFFS